jgi:hypothetical protein
LRIVDELGDRAFAGRACDLVDGADDLLRQAVMGEVADEAARWLMLRICRISTCTSSAPR